ncbi:MAG: dynamin family protein [Bacteroidaceae bacterium]|nr:dynamin family protein [Bacteroidaceae bacterium]
MKDIEKISCIAEYLQLDNVVEELKAIDFRSKQENANLILPLVGEFSSGKTTLINALTDCKKLETATKPTTATIYEVHFGCNTCRADVVDENGNIRGVEDIASLKNEELTEAQVVTVFDTSKRVPSNTILVDTPGLSSPDPKHKQMLVNFLPQADGIMLVTDINQQITRSLTDFIETMKLSKRPIYLILTKADTKSGSEIEAAKKYISDNCQISLKQMAVVSAVKDSLDDLYALFDAIQRDKKEIIRQVDENRVDKIVKTMTLHVEELMKASSSDKEMDEAVRRCQHELDKINRNIDRLIDSMADDIQDQERSVSRNFEDTISAKLNNLVTNKSNNFDAEAVSLINNTATLLMSDYKNGIHTILRDKAQSQKGSENEVSLSSLENLDLSSLQMSGLSYNLDLNTMGHEYDGWIKTGVIAVAAVAATAAMASTGGAAAGAAASKAIDIADTVTDVGSMISNQKLAQGQQTGNNKGLIDSMVGFATDKMISKPQRIRAIRNYIDDILAPEFKIQLHNISQTVVSSIRSGLHSEASTLISQKTEALNQLKAEMAEKKEQFNQKMSKLREFKTTLLTI